MFSWDPPLKLLNKEKVKEGVEKGKEKKSFLPTI
jgi:hypothetical protein